MVSAKVVVINEVGLHLRPAGYLCKLAMNYPCKIELRIDNRTVNAKSVLGVLSACVKNGDEIEIICDGEKEEEALRVLIDAVASDFVESVNNVKQNK